MTYAQNPALSSYQTQAAMTATPGGLVLMLFDGALAAIGKSEAALTGDQDLETAHRELTRAQDIVAELHVSLDYDAGGQIAASLGGLYQFCIDQLVTANLAKDPTLLPPVAKILADLRTAFGVAAEEAA